MSSYSTTKSRVLQYIGIILIIGVFAGAYWYFKVYGSTLNKSPTGSLTSNLVSYWTFDGADTSSTTATDRGSSTNHGTLVDGPPRVQGKVGQALNFDGAADYVSTSGTPSIGTTYTVSAWVKPTSVAVNGVFVSYRSTSVSGNVIFQLDQNNADVRFIFGVSPTYATATFSNALTVNTWYHVVGVRNGTTARVYVNGVEGTSATSGTSPTGNSINIGAIVDGSATRTAFASGPIDEVRMYDRALATAEIQSLYDLGQSDKTNSSISQPQGTGRLDSGLAAYFPLDNGSGTSATDASTNGNTGTLTNGPTWNTGQIGGDVVFDGTDDYIEIGSSVKVDNSDRGAISAWVRFDSWSSIDATYNPVFSYGGPGAASAGNLLLEQRYFTNTHYLAVEQGNNGETRDIVRGSTALALSTWYHVAVVSNGTSYKLYLNGVPETLTVFSGSNTGDWFNDTSLGETDRSVIGARYGNGAVGANLGGALDEVRIYNRTLADDEVAQLYRLTTPTSVDTGLKGYWSFNAQDMPTSTTAADRSGAGNTGTLTSGPTRALGKLGQALSFDGTDDYTTVADANTLDITGAISMGLWVKTSDTDSCIMSKTVVSTAKCFESAGNKVYELGILSNTIYFQTSNGTTANVVSGSASSITDNQWHYLVATWDGTTGSNGMKIYLDGNVLHQGTATVATTQSTSSALTFGGNGGSYDYAGLLDEARLYNRALTAAEIKGLYDVGASDKANSSVSQPQGTGRLDSGLTGYWPLDENTGTSAADSSTNGTAGTLTNGPTWTTGQIGSAVTFDGTNDYISVGTGTVGISAGSKGLTLSSFVNVTTFQSYTVMIGKSHTSTYGGWQLNTNADTGNRFGGGVNVSGVWTAITSANTYSTGVWYHVSMTYDGVTMRLYVNGVLDTTVAAAGSIQYATNEAAEVNIGRNPASDVPSRYLTGSLDEVRVYNRPLSPDEISQLYRLAAPTGVDTGLKGYWSFNGQDMNDTTAYDRSGTGNIGALSGSPAKTIGKVGQAISFDGSDDYINITDTAYTGTFSFAAWFYTANNSQTGIFFGEDSSNAGNAGPKIGISSGSFFFRIVSSTDTAVSVPTASQWHHFVLTRNSSDKMDLYIDGGSATRLFSDAAQTGTYTLDKLGSNGQTTDQLYTGKLDEIRTYNRALSADEVKALYNSSR